MWDLRSELGLFRGFRLVNASSTSSKKELNRSENSSVVVDSNADVWREVLLYG